MSNFVNELEQLKSEYLINNGCEANTSLICDTTSDEEWVAIYKHALRTGDSIFTSYLKLLFESDFEFMDIDSVNIPLKFLVSPPNPNTVSRKIERILNGEIKPILIDDTNTIIDGYATLLLLQERGETVVPFRKVVKANTDKASFAMIYNISKKQIYDTYEGKCYICGRETKLTGVSNSSATIDHIVPISKGGSNDYSNLALCCVLCNGLKSNFTYSEELRTVIRRELVEQGIKVH